tara:strand:- start:442 stop:681 length:240 start_codon:yes stop_codon:yes gene_type:complete
MMITTHKANVVHTSEAGVEIFIEGMGTRCEQGGSPIYLDKHDGKWVLKVWADINQEDPTHVIDLEKAYEHLLDDSDEIR